MTTEQPATKHLTTERVALVTGAARGMGAATVERLSAEGYRVVAVDWCRGDDTPLPYPQGTRAELDAVVGRAPAGTVLPVMADVRDRTAMGAAVDLAVQTWGRLDAVVTAAAVIAGGTALWEAPAEHLELQWQVDVSGTWNCAAAAVPAMLAGPDPAGCRFVAIASAAGRHGLYHLAAYNAAKHAVVGIVRGLAADLVGTGVTAVAVSPGATATSMLAATADLYGVTTDDLAGHQLLRRVLAPQELAATIAFCCSPQAGVLNGSVVSADGGFPG